MVKKKSVKKRSVNKSKKLVRYTKKKINLALKNLILFGVLSLIFFMLYSVSSNETYENLFLLFSMLLGFVGLAFLVVLLIFLVLKIMKR